MSKVTKLLVKDTLLLIAVGLPVIMGLMLLRSATAGPTPAELTILSLINAPNSTSILRATIICLMAVNTLLAYRLIANWYGRRRAALSLILLASIPTWILMQFNFPQLTLVLTPLLLGMLAFDYAGRSTKSVLWYAISGIAVSAAWLQEPIASTVMLITLFILLILSKPRYIKHIARQALLVPILLIICVATTVAISVKLNLGLQAHLVNQLSPVSHLNSMYALLVTGPTSYRFGLPGVGIIPLPIILLGGLGAWQIFIQRKRPRNLFILLFGLVMMALVIPFGGLTLLLTTSFALLAVAVWAMIGIEYLHRSWQRIFPHNRLANNTADLLIVALIAFMALYSYWYVAKAWTGNPQARMESLTNWDGQL